MKYIILTSLAIFKLAFADVTVGQAFLNVQLENETIHPTMGIVQYDTRIDNEYSVSIDLGIKTDGAPYLTQDIGVDSYLGLFGHKHVDIAQATSFYVSLGVSQINFDSLDLSSLSGLTYGVGLRSELTDRLGLKIEFNKTSYSEEPNINYAFVGLSYRLDI